MTQDTKENSTSSTTEYLTTSTPSSHGGQQENREHTIGWGARLLVNLCRFVLGATFVFSGYVKAIDPLGGQYKIEEYLVALHLESWAPGWLTLTASVLLAALEFSLGIFILFAIRRHLVSRLSLLLMAVMTAITLWVAVANPVKDCGCFGDALILSNGQTLLKNVVLLLCALVLCLRPNGMYRFISRTNQWIAINFTILFIFITSIYCLYTLPVFDFRPYHVGVNILKAMLIPDDAPQPQFKTTFILEKNGVRKEFALEDYPDSTWHFVDSKTVQTKAGYEPPVHDFEIQDKAGRDLTEDILSRKGYLFLLISPNLSKANDSNFGSIDQIYEYARQEKIPFYGLTASTQKDINHWVNVTGAEYPFYRTDETTLKTVIRSNPGLLLLKDGTIIQKWSHNMLPSAAQWTSPLSKMDIGHYRPGSVWTTITQILLWFFLPLILLTLADRVWAWSKYVKLKTKKIGMRITHTDGEHQE